MIKRIVSFALHQPLFVVLGMVLFVGAGIAAFKALPIEAFPGRHRHAGQRHHALPGPRGRGGRAAGHDPARGRARRASRTRCACSRTRSSACRSSSSPSTTRPTRTSRASRCSSGCAKRTCPRACTPELAPLSTPIGEIYRVPAASRTRIDSRELRTLQDWVVVRQLKLVPGVADVVSLGGLIKQYEVQPRPREAARLQGHAAAADRGARARQRQRRRRLHRAGPPAVPDPRHRPAALGRRHRQHRGRRAQRRAGAGEATSPT